MEPLLSGPPAKRTSTSADTKSGLEINVRYFPLYRTPIRRTPLLSGRGHGHDKLYLGKFYC